MSMNGSLLTAYSDPGGGGGASKPAAPVSTSALSTTTSSSSTSGPENHHGKDGKRLHRRSSRKRKGCCLYAHLNTLWSVWYGLLAAGAQGYMIVRCARRFLGFASMTWPGAQNPPLVELNSYLAMIGLAIFFLPFFIVSALFKIGNLANDGFKLGRHLSTCSADPPSALLGPTTSGSHSSSSGGALRSLWQHGGPTAPFLHLTTAFCLLMPKLMMEAKLIQVGVLPKDDIWRTDLDFLLQPRDRLVVLSFMTHPGNSSLFLGQSAPSTPGNLSNLTLLPTPQPLMTSTGSSGIEEEIGLESRLSPAIAIAAGLRAILSPEYPTGTSSGGWGVSAEYLNYAVALIVYAVRYPAVFWTTNKAFGTLFSCQLLANAAQQLISFASFCVLYKVQVVGVDLAVPLLRRHVSSDPPFLLDAHVSLALFVLSQILVIASSLVLYLYGYGRFQSFLNQERDRRVIMLRAGFSGGGGWIYFTHCASLCVLASLGVCQAPLLHDYTNLYRGTLDPTVLAGVAAGIGHLLLWVVVWLIFTAKRRWIFKLRVTVGRAAVRSARSVKLVTDVDLISSSRRRSGEDSSAPLLVVGNGRTYTVSDGSPKKAIMAVIQKAAMERKARQGQDSRGNSEDGEEQIYWLRPKLPSPKSSNDNDQRRANWFHRKLNGRNGVKHKVTFDDQLVGRKNKSKGTNGIKSPKSKTAKTPVAPHKGLRQLSESEDDGDYATLRELPGMAMAQPPPPIAANESAEDSVSEDNKLLDHVLCDDTVTYARTNRDLLNPRDYESTSTITTNNVTTDATGTATVTVHNDPSTTQPSQGGPMTPRCFRRADSGIMPHDELTTPRSSESVSTEEGSSPPSSGGSRGVGGSGGGSGGHSETSSGVHSNSSTSEPPPQMPPLIPVNGVPSRRSTSVDDLAGVELPNGNCMGASGPGSNSWRSYSLQRNMTPPTEATPGVMCVQPPQHIQPPLHLQQQHQQQQQQQQLQHQPLQQQLSVQPAPLLPQPLVSMPTQNGPTSTAIYSFGPGGYATKEVVLDSESTVVIRRNKSIAPGVATVAPPPPPPPPLEPFGRSTNMRMTSFMEASTASSATLPHYPTQQPPSTLPYPHCSTMPHTTHPAPQQNSLGSHHLIYPRPHTTIPTHHNGIRLFPTPPVKRYQVPQYQSIVKHSNINNNNNNHHRDSANFSIASSSGNESTCAQGSY